MQLESYKGNNYKRLKIRDFKDKEPRSKDQTKDFKRRRHLSRLYSNSNSLKIVYIYIIGLA